MAEEVEDGEFDPCPHCGKPIAATARICPYCRENPDMPMRDDSLRRLIPYRNPAALWAYYLAIFSLLPCFPLGIAAFVLGLRGLTAVKERPLIHGTAHAWIGVVLGGFCALVWLVVTILAVTGNLFPR